MCIWKHKSASCHRVIKLRVASRVKLSAESHSPILTSQVNLSVIHREVLGRRCIAIHNATMKIFPPELAQVFICRAKCSHGQGYNYLEFSYKGTLPCAAVDISHFCCERSVIVSSIVMQLFLWYYETYGAQE